MLPLKVCVRTAGVGAGSVDPIFYLVPPLAAKLTACSSSKVPGNGVSLLSRKLPCPLQRSMVALTAGSYVT